MYGYKDPFNRKCFQWNNMDEELLQFFIKLGKIHKKYKFLSNAETKIVEANSNVFIFERFVPSDEDSGFIRKRKNKERMLIAVNRLENEVKISVPEAYEKSKNILELNATGNTISSYGIIIKSFS